MEIPERIRPITHENMSNDFNEQSLLVIFTYVFKTFAICNKKQGLYIVPTHQPYVFHVSLFIVAKLLHNSVLIL